MVLTKSENVTTITEDGNIYTIYGVNNILYKHNKVISTYKKLKDHILITNNIQRNKTIIKYIVISNGQLGVTVANETNSSIQLAKYNDIIINSIQYDGEITVNVYQLKDLKTFNLKKLNIASDQVQNIFRRLNFTVYNFIFNQDKYLVKLK